MAYTEKNLPMNKELEKEVLATILANNELLFSSGLQKHHFYDVAHANMFDVIQKMSAKKIVYDFESVDSVIRTKSYSSVTGGQGYVYKLKECYKKESRSDFLRNTEILKDYYNRRTAIEIADNIKNMARDTSNSMSDVLVSIHSGSQTIANNSKSSTKTTIADAVNSINKIVDGEVSDVKYAYTYHQGFDDKIAGMELPCYFVIGARSSVGKTAEALRWIWDMARHGKKVVFFSTEMNLEKLIKRIASFVLNIHVIKWKTRNFSKQDRESIEENLPMIKKVLEENVIIHDSGRCSPSQIRALSYQAKADFGGVLDAIVIDYLQNLVPDLRGSKKDFFDVNEISSSIYELSKELKILVVALSQLNRISVTDRPTEANMSESDQIVRDADVIMLMHRKQDRKTREDKNDVLMLDIVKGRDIGTHELLVLFEPNTQRFISDIDERTLLTQEEWDNINNPTFNKGKKAFDKLYDVKY